jgi:type I restriction enzyme S subunit
MSSGSSSIVGKSALLTQDWMGSFGAFCAAIRGNPTKVDAGFLAHFLAGAKFRTFAGSAQGNNIKNLNKSALEGYPVPLPPLDEQRRIVGLLDRAAEIRRRADAARAKARAIIPALFLNTFGDPATNPKGWPVATVGDVLDSASYGTSQKASDAGGGLPVIRMGNVTMNGQLDTTDLKYMELTEAEREKAELLEGDLLFNRTNSKELVGKTGLWDGRFDAVAASYFIRLRVNRERIVPAYLWAFFNTSHMKRVLFQTARGAIGQANINAKELRAFPVATPSLPLQSAFAEQASRIDSLARHLDAAAAKAEAMAAGLSAEVFGASPQQANGRAA